MKKTKIIFGVALAASILGWLFEISDGIADPYPAEMLYSLGVAMLIPSCIILFKPTAEKVWFKFALVWGFISVLTITSTPKGSESWLPLFFIDQKQMTWVMSALLLLAGLIIAFWPRRR